MATTVTTADVKAAYPGQVSKTDTRIQDLIDKAERLADSVFSGRIAREGELQADRDDFIELVALHKLTLEEGGELQSESQSGGTVNFAQATPRQARGLHQTRFGREALTYIRDETSIGVEFT